MITSEVKLTWNWCALHWPADVINGDENICLDKLLFFVYWHDSDEVSQGRWTDLVLWSDTGSYQNNRGEGEVWNVMSKDLFDVLNICIFILYVIIDISRHSRRVHQYRILPDKDGRISVQVSYLKLILTAVINFTSF